MDNIEIAKAITSLPLAVLLTLVLIGGYLGWWIYGSIHKAEMADMAKQLADERARTAAEKMRGDAWEKRYLTDLGSRDVGP